MKRIVPFNNILEFSTDVCEITSISLEHDINIENDVISGTFFIKGDYKITDGDIRREEFNFELPFDIALGKKYDTSTLIVDIDDFRYELVDHNKLKINIDLYIDGEEIAEDDLIHDDSREEVLDNEEPIKTVEINRDLDEIIDNNVKETLDNVSSEVENVNINNNDIDIFNGFNENEKYVTYRVYRVSNGDTIDSILQKYGVTLEEVANYNDITDIKEGDKLVIPANDK